MAPIIFSREAKPVQVPEHDKISRSTVAYICGGAAVGIVLISIFLGWLFRASRRKRRIRERRKTRQARREKLNAADNKPDYQRSYSMKTITSESSYTPTESRQPMPQSERWKWNPPGDPEKTAAAIHIPPNAKFF
jgi:heme exporter protein D